MQFKGLILAEREESYIGKKGKVTMRILSLLDQDKTTPALNTLDYVVTEEETKVYNGELDSGKVIEIGVQNFRPAFGGRLRLEGKILTPPKDHNQKKLVV